MKNRTLSKSFKCALDGIIHTIINERNMKLHLCATVIAITVALYFKFTYLELAIFILTIIIVISLEMVNTAIERSVNLTIGTKHHELAKQAKDIAAGAVLIAAIGAVVIGVLMCLRHLS